MSADAEKGTQDRNEFQSSKSDEESCSGLWEVYLGEAKRYDISLLEGWKSDMDGMLLFSALYSATLTALIVESYKTLQVDPADETVDILIQIAQGLVSISNGTAASFEIPSPYQPSTSALWTRDFIHKVNMRPSSVVSARVLAFSYFGLRKFGMHTFVDVIPILLHLSLLLFFAGLVGFLKPVNSSLMYIMAGVLAVFTTIYIGLSLLPLLYFDAPYRTPLSDILWRSWNGIIRRLPRVRGIRPNYSLNNAIVQKSSEISVSRDRLCIEYTLNSLHQDTELLPLLEAIPEVILKPGGVRVANATIIFALVHSPNPAHNLISRISNFIAQPALSADPVSQDRLMTAALKALWSLAYFLATTDSVHFPGYSIPAFWFDRRLAQKLRIVDGPAASHRISTLALVRTSRLQSIKRCIDRVAEILQSSPTEDKAAIHRQLDQAKTVLQATTIQDIHQWDSQSFRDCFSNLMQTLHQGSLAAVTSADLDWLLRYAKELVACLQHPGRWKAAQLSIMSECFSPGSIHQYEAVGTYAPLLAIGLTPDNVFRDTRGTVPHQLFLRCLQVFFSTNYGHSSLPEPTYCRAIVERYFARLVTDAAAPLIQDPTSHHLDTCLVYDLRNGAKNDEDCIFGITSLYNILVFSSHETIAFRLQNIAYREAYTQWILCNHILDSLDSAPQHPSQDDASFDVHRVFTDSQLMTIRMLGEQLLPGDPVPDSPPSPCSFGEYQQWRGKIYDYLVSINLIIISKYASTCIEYNLAPLPFVRRARRRQPRQAYKTSQIAWARATSKIVSSYINWHYPTPPEWKRLFEVAVFSISRDWTWIDDMESVMILLAAIDLHRESPTFGGMIEYEQALYDHCQAIVQGQSAQHSDPAARDTKGGFGERH
ncbi:hypothetical protein D9758_009932 [Tetrapyrgos nigripes]|uniref:DUF6535 domain-containing protein n=1 Tax=Tetrapyrgos nigripes TaxID=182062 RepID=A0A8H5CT73_9AGAR|nr:hypothetical protein D9758_009932 [Tetrapyrgos nigripes]